MITIQHPLIIVPILALAILLGGFQIRQLMDCATEETGKEKEKWLQAILLLPAIGALLYYFKRRPQRLAESKQAMDASGS